MNKSESIAKLSIALSKFQAEVKNPPNSANNPFFKSKYAPLDVVINTAKESLGKYGLSYIQIPSGNGESVSCVTIIMCEGEWIESEVLTLKADKVTAQGAGSAITYARRYQLSAMLGLAGEEDDDGNHATGNGKKEEKKEDIKKTTTIDREQLPKIDKNKIESIKILAEKKGINQASICAAYNITTFDQMIFETWKEATDKLNLRPDKKANPLEGVI